MKKLFLILVAAISSLLTVGATDNLVVPDLTIPKGGEGYIDVQLNNELPYVTFAFTLTLPEGINYVDMEESEERFAPQAGQYLPIKDPSDDGRTIGLGSLAITENSFAGNSGTLVKIKVMADESLEMGTVLSATITGVKFSTNDDEKTLEDVTFTITIGEPDDGRLKFYETSASLPPYTAGEKADVKMFRTIRAGQWSTICLPFTLPKAKAEAVFGTDVELYEFTGYTTTVDVEGDLTPTHIQVNFSRYKLENSLSSIIGGTPYLIKTSRDIDNFEVDNVKLVNTVKTVSKSDTEYEVLEGCFKGTFVKTKIPENGLFVSDNQFWYSTGETNVKAFRAWFELDAVLNQEIALSRISMNFEDEPTGIRTVGSLQLASDGYYNLNGQRVENPKKGLYIKNNKKVVVK